MGYGMKWKLESEDINFNKVTDNKKIYWLLKVSIPAGKGSGGGIRGCQEEIRHFFF